MSNTNQTTDVSPDVKPKDQATLIQDLDENSITFQALQRLNKVSGFDRDLKLEMQNMTVEEGVKSLSELLIHLVEFTREEKEALRSEGVEIW